MKFILNDERVTNSYGFRVKTAGIKLDRFLSNPVCLNNHSNNTKDVLGNWVDTEKQGHLLTAKPQFDTEDAEGKEVVRKVEKGILKACSMGISFDPDNLVMEDGVLTVTECELLEASICAVPSNSAAITLYNKQGEILSERQIKQICLSAQNTNSFKNKPMNKLKSYLQLDANADETAIIGAVKA
ncbi:HK97 family phage prohead protease, partial [Riemerella anatipestifer]